MRGGTAGGASCVPRDPDLSEHVGGDRVAIPGRRLELVSSWTELPELVTANQGEAGIVDLCHHLIGRGVGIEAGLLELEDARAFVTSGLTDSCVRVLVETPRCGCRRCGSPRGRRWKKC